MIDGPLQEYEKVFEELVRTFADFSKERPHNITGGPEEAGASARLVQQFGIYMMEKLKTESTPEEMLKYIEVIDKLYFQCLMKNEICSGIFDTLYEQNPGLFTRVEQQLPEAIRNDLKAWMEKHGKNVFGNEPGPEGPEVSGRNNRN